MRYKVLISFKDTNCRTRQTPPIVHFTKTLIEAEDYLQMCDDSVKRFQIVDKVNMKIVKEIHF